MSGCIGYSSGIVAPTRSMATTARELVSKLDFAAATTPTDFVNGKFMDKNMTKEPARYELIDKAGMWCGEFATAIDAACFATRMWPDQSQDPDRTGAGWDIQTVGADR